MMNNYKLKIQYDGTNYSGWQIQENSITVQQKIVDAIKIITKEDMNLIGSGRTDTGVHSLGQIANFRTEIELDLYKFQYSLNSILPKDISVTEITKAAENFHARFDALKRSYVYLFCHIKSPFYEKYSYQYPPFSITEIERLNKISRILLGEHDFTSFAKKSEHPDDKKCIVYNINWRKGKDVTYFFIEANRFLHGMVRTIIGTLLFAKENNLDEKYLLDVLNQKDRSRAEESVPAKGLFLYKVKYDE